MMDEVVVKPISPAIFLAKIMVWVRRSRTVPIAGLSLVEAGSHRLDPARRYLRNPARLSQMLITACLAYLWMICQGPQVIAANQTALKHCLDFQPLESLAYVRQRNLKDFSGCSI